MPNLSSLAPITTAASALSSLVLVTPQSTSGYQPLNPPNADGKLNTAALPPNFLFNYEGEQSLTLTSDITDHFVENNRAIQDQIALKPEVYVTRGFIGELNDIAPFALQPLKIAADKLTTISAYTPQLSTTALLAYNEAFLAYQIAANAVNSAVSAWSSIGNLAGFGSSQSIIGDNGLTTGNMQNKQQIAFQLFYGYWNQRILFNVQTPWAVFQNMAIMSLRAVQHEETNVITDFEVQFKRIRTAITLSTGVTGIVAQQARAASQSSTLTNNGSSTPGPTDSLASKLPTQ